MSEEVKTDPAPAPADTELTEIGELIKSSGYSKADVNRLVQSEQSLASIRNLIEHNPIEFLNTLERNNPEAARSFHDKLAQNYVERYATKDGESQGDDKQKDLMTKIQLLKQKVSDSETRESRRDQAAMMAQVKNMYEARVDTSINDLPADLKLTKSEKAAFKAQLNQRLASDPQIVERCARGNFVDVPKTFKSILDEWSNDRKEAAETEKKSREDAKARSFAEGLGGPNMFAVPSEKELADATESWDATEAALARALERT